MTDDDARERYGRLRADDPELFANPPDAMVEILTDPADVAAAERAAAERLSAAGLPVAWARTGVVFEDQYGLLIRDAVRWPDRTLGTYLRGINPGNAPGVVILPAIGGEVLLLRHFRHATRRWHLEFPRGYGTPGSPPEQDARQELREEAGATADRLVELGVIYPDTGASGTPVQLYYAELSGYTGPRPGELIGEIRTVPPARLAELIRTGEIDDGFTINAYARAVLRGLLPPLR